ncbi:MAG: transcription antitermination factor NusB [Verrucomicrobia bacterium]|nr:transcription antitermination factor NusB [Verrucomicrobiota bacterium]
MGKRRDGREVALQLLFHWDLNGCEDLSADDLSRFWALRTVPANLKEFAVQLVQGVIQHHAEIDERISRYTANYELKRISAVDRNLLRLAIYEMWHVPDVPPVVAINEAIDIAKKYGTEESSRFVNGVLDRIKMDLKRPLRTALPADGAQTG